MTDHTDEVFDDVNERQAMDDLELITRMLNNQLDPERVAAVRQRLETDAAFRDLAAPLMLLWSVPPRRERVPRPEGELEREWEKFKQRPRIKQLLEEPVATVTTKRKPRWPYWIAGLVLAVAGVVAITVVAKRRPDGSAAGTEGTAAVAATSTPAPTPESVADVPLKVAAESPSTLVPYQAGWITLASGIEVQLEPGAELRVAKRRLRLMRHMMLTGTARFRIPLLDSLDAPMRVPALILQTSVGYLIANESEFTVSARPDTTDVEVHALHGRGNIPPAPMILSPVFAPVDRDQFVLLVEPGRARLVRDENPVLVMTEPTTPPIIR